MLNKNEKTTAKMCDNCGKKGVILRSVTRSYGKGNSQLLIECVPVVSCPHCGESYMTAETAREVERIKLHRKSLALNRNVPVAAFA